MYYLCELTINSSFLLQQYYYCMPQRVFLSQIIDPEPIESLMQQVISPSMFSCSLVLARSKFWHHIRPPYVMSVLQQQWQFVKKAVFLYFFCNLKLGRISPLLLCTCPWRFLAKSMHTLYIKVICRTGTWWKYYEEIFAIYLKRRGKFIHFQHSNGIIYYNVFTVYTNWISARFTS